ncbi:MAG: AEC family transporter, partial [Geminicoccaceae bacterium]
MSAAFGAIAPVFLLLVLGFAFGRRRFPAVGFWPAAERLVYWCLFPALLLRTTAGVESGGAVMLGIA